MGDGAPRLRSGGPGVRLIDCIASGVTPEDLKEVADTFDPDIVFMETSAPSFSADVEVMTLLGRPTIAGGAHATATCREHLDAGFDAIIRGEYDQVISEALDLAERSWLATESHPDAVHAPRVAALDAIPYPAWDRMPREQ